VKLLNQLGCGRFDHELKIAFFFSYFLNKIKIIIRNESIIKSSQFKKEFK
jgi:hypothetical protein